MSDAPPPPPANLPPNPELEASIKFQLEHWNDDRRPAIITSGWVLYVLAVVAVILRFYAKRLIRNSFKAEDGLILAALFGGLGLAIHNTIGAIHGGGLHSVRAGEKNIAKIPKSIFSFQLIYFPTILAIKFSILLFLHRTFSVSRRFRIAVYCVGAFSVAWFLAATIATIFQCTPVSYYWNPAQPGRCTIVPLKFAFATSILNAVSDFVVVALPIPMVWKLDLPSGRKVGVCAIFLLGGVVILASVIRLMYFQKIKLLDPTYELVDMGIWSAVEPNLGIVGACMPLMTPIFRKIKDKYRKISPKNSNDNDNASPRGNRDGMGWNLSRLKEEQAKVAHNWVNGEDGATPPSNLKSDVSLGCHGQCADADSEKNSRQPEMSGPKSAQATTRSACTCDLQAV